LSYRGFVAEFVFGLQGLNASKNQIAIPHSALIEAENITYEDVSFRGIGGADLLDANGVSGAPEIFDVFDYHPSDGLQRLLSAASDGKLYKEVDGDIDSVTLGSGLSTTERGHFVAAGQEATGADMHAIYFNGVDAPRVLNADGSTVDSDVTTKAADWSGTNQPIGGFIHRASLVAFGNLNAPHRIYISAPGDHEEFVTGVTFFQIMPGIGERIFAGTSFKGLAWFFKYPFGIAFLDDRDASSSNWYYKLYTSAVGIAPSPKSILNIGDDILFLSAEGTFHLLTAVQPGEDDIRQSDLSHALNITPWIRDNIALDRLGQVNSVWYSHKRKAMFSLPRVGSQVNDAILEFDFSDKSTPKFSYSFRDSATALAMRLDETRQIRTPIHGTSAGQVYLMDRANQSKDSAGYLKKFMIPHTDFSWLDRKLAGKRKNYQFIELHGEPLGTYNLTVEVFLDGVVEQTFTMALTPRGGALGTFVLGSDQLAGTQAVRNKASLYGSSDRFSVRVSNNGENENFSLSKMLVGFTPGPEDLS